jgi:hypothetical protein
MKKLNKKLWIALNLVNLMAIIIIFVSNFSDHDKGTIMLLCLSTFSMIHVLIAFSECKIK